MKNENKLQNYFFAFSEKDWDQFGLFLNSPFFNKNPVFNHLFDYFNKNRSKEKPDRLWAQRVFSHVFPEAIFKDGRLRTLFWRMCKLVETYLAVSNLTNDKEAMETQLILALGKQEEWFKLFEKEVKSKMKKDHQKAIEYPSLLQSVNLHHQLYFHEDYKKYSSGHVEIHQLIEDLDQFIHLAKLKYHCELLFRKQILKEEESQPLLPDHLLEQLKISGLQNEEPVISIYAQLIRMKETEDWKFYVETKQNFELNRDKIDPEEQLDILSYLINFIIYLDKNRDNSLFDEMLELYQFGLSSGILIMHNRISYERFTNIAILGSIQKKFAWTDKFILDYQSFLKPAKSSLAIKLTRAYWNFHQEKYEKVLDWTHEIDIYEDKPDNPFRLRALKLRAFYELYRQDKTYRRLLYNFMSSFSKFIKDNRKLANQLATAYLNFIRMTKLLLSIQNSAEFNEEKKQKFLSKMSNTHPLVLKKWLLEKIKEL
ncbi:MAG: hypothetical protein ACI8P3_001623 [Saprospiraceae bacterium]|jgi:hypothetical protein